MQSNHKNSNQRKIKPIYNWLLGGAIVLGGICAVNACLDQTSNHPNSQQAEQAQNSPSVLGKTEEDTTEVASNRTESDPDVSGTSNHEADSSSSISPTASDSGKADNRKDMVPDKGGTTKKDASKKADTGSETAAVMKNTNSSSGAFKESQGLSWPVKGDILLNYSTDATVYYKTLGQYRSNPAIVISSRTGTDVLSAAAGTVKSIKKDDMTGTTVTVDIGNHYTLTYGQLDHLNVKEGDRLKEGEVIGTIADPTNYYVVEGSNLYFAVQKKNKSINPLLLLNEVE